MSATTALAILATVWAAIGVVTGIVMGRRGHDPFPWWLLGVVLGPLVVPLALAVARRTARMRERRLTPGVGGPGPVDMLAGVDGSPQAAAALAAALDLFGSRVGRLTLVAVSDRSSSVAAHRKRVLLRAELERQAKLATSRLTGHSRGETRGWAPGLVMGAGNPAEVLGRLAAEGGYDVLVVGGRGAGLSKAVLGSAASSLASRAKVPVLLGGAD